jgi:hypothetical protein
MVDKNVFDNEEPTLGPFTYEQALNLLGLCERGELRDHAFGDREVFWIRNGVEVAGGYFGGGNADVWINEEFGGGSFKGNEARELAARGSNVKIERNDETGPDTYEGA